MSSASPSSTFGLAILPLRLFLGGTFVYAGLQKLADPSIFDPSSPGSIQSQLKAVASTSPIGSVIRAAEHVPILVGVAIALGELAVGLGALLGLRTRIAAVGGMVISLALFLTVSWQDRPYYLGSDIVFLFAWTPLALAGAGNIWALDSWLATRAAGDGRRASPEAAPAAAPEPAPALDPAPTPEPAPAPEPAATPEPAPALRRRDVLSRSAATGAAAAAGLALAGLAAGLGRLLHTNPEPAVRSSGSPLPPPHNPVVRNARAIPVGSSVTFTDPTTGDPAILVRPQPGLFVAFDAVCPHAGCHVSYWSNAAEFVCPCHGSRFNGNTGAVLSGPATRGLTRIAVSVSADGSVDATT